MRNIMIETDVPATMRDGTVLRADVYRPSDEGPWPVLLMRVPYNKTVKYMALLHDPLGLAQRGYIVVFQDTRGRFASEGDWEPYTFEAEDGYDSVQWAATMPGSNGSVGMFGRSYMGSTQWTAALTQPPALKAIAPDLTWSEPENGLFRRGGATELGITIPWTLTQGIDTVKRRNQNDRQKLMASLGALISELDNAASGAYWELPADAHPAFVRHDVREVGGERSVREPGWSDCLRVAGRQAEVEVPVLNTGGWFDIFAQGTLDNYVALFSAGRPAHLIMGPWHHISDGPQVGDVNFGMAAGGELVGFRGSLTDIRAGFFRKWLDSPESATPVQDLPPVLLFVMGIGQWREESRWPLTRAVDTPLYLRSGGSLSFDAPEDEGVETFSYDPSSPVPTTGGNTLLTTEYRPGPLDQAAVEARPDVLVYSSEILTHDTEVTGRVTATLVGRSDAESTDWVVRVCDVDTEGVSLNVVDGIVRTATTPGQSAEHIVDLWSTSYVFRAGHRIRVQVTSSNFPRWDRNPATLQADGTATPTRYTVHHAPSRKSFISLPIVPAGSK